MPFILALLSAAVIGQSLHAIDVVDLSSWHSRQSHSVQFTGAAVRKEKFRIGALELPVSGVRMTPGGSVRVALKSGGSSTGPFSLLVTLATAPHDFGKVQSYTMLLNGTEVYRSAELDRGGGFTRSVFLPVESNKRRLVLEVRTDSGSGAPVTLSMVRCYEQERPPTDMPPRLRMGLALLTSTGYGYTLDVPTMRRIAALHPVSPYIRQELALVYNFCSRDSEANRKKIDSLSAMAEETGIPLRVAFQMHWGGTPVGIPDSGGVTFSDPVYQMITYDPDDRVDDPGLREVLGNDYDIRFGLSVPNVWSDTPWLTFNNPRLNRFRQNRLADVLGAWQAARERLEIAGRDSLFPPEISTGEETVYWAKGVTDDKYTALNGGRPRADLMADFNPSVFADALRDGVRLDPRDGLDEKERTWLHQNMANWQQKIVDWMVEDSPPAPVRITSNGPVFADDLVRRNVFTEPYALPLYPMKDISPYHPGLESGYVRDGRSGGEYWSGAAMLPWLEKERERGRIALPNVECTVTDDAQLVACMRAAYAYGARFTTLYNWHMRTNTAALLKEFADSIDHPPAIGLIPSGEGRVTSAWGTYTREYRAPPCAFGVNSVELFPSPGADLSGGLRVALRDIDSAGSGLISMTIAHPIVETGRLVIQLPGMFLQEPGRRYMFTVETHSPGVLRTASGGEIAVRLYPDIVIERLRSLTIEDWQDAADIIASVALRAKSGAGTRYTREALEESRRLFEGGRPCEAYRAAIRAEQLLLPAAFDLPEHGGKLSPYPVTVIAEGGPLRATIGRIGPGSAVVLLRSPVAQRVRVRCEGYVKTTDLPAGETVELDFGRGG